MHKNELFNVTASISGDAEAVTQRRRSCDDVPCSPTIAPEHWRFSCDSARPPPTAIVAHLMGLEESATSTSVSSPADGSGDCRGEEAQAAGRAGEVRRGPQDSPDHRGRPRRRDPRGDAAPNVVSPMSSATPPPLRRPQRTIPVAY
jgi:hypothetical protein